MSLRFYGGRRNVGQLVAAAAYVPPSLAFHEAARERRRCLALPCVRVCPRGLLFAGASTPGVCGFAHWGRVAPSGVSTCVAAGGTD